MTVRADHSHLEQVVMNLAVNARDAMPEGGILTLGTEAGTRAGDEPRGRIARLFVSDTGVGHDGRSQGRRSSSPSSRPRGPTRGPAWAWPPCSASSSKRAGRIKVQSTPGFGSSFRIDFPWCDGFPSSINATPLPPIVQERPLSRDASVLLVEDEDAVRKLARITLEGRGYTVTDAPDGESALRLLTTDRHVDILVTDMTMPGIDGRELAGQVKARAPIWGSCSSRATCPTWAG